MAASTIFAASKPINLHQPIGPKTTFLSLKPNSISENVSAPSNHRAPSLNLSLEDVSSTRKQFLNVGFGLLGALFALPLEEARATRVEYYATVEEPSCDLNYVKSGLGYCDISVGNGVEAPLGELINIHYTARFMDGTVFDSSYKRGRPLTMRIGAGKVIPGLDQGIMGGDGVPPMHAGGKRKLLIPPELAYGPEPAGCFSGDCNIPANATLLYDILFVAVYK
ncbi:hypothetical protein AMTRI_Chr04g188910 [Amborella trichopoda]|uniref:peptidylprolyl isomerase n=1 Tax=Amborella trichopoda TaxID=13333 RepID=W1NEQ9_AMBTC|nr:photosynthetic NDH subunit of lumenal location 4, chloroplastic [Amborella trichopoda]ERM94242.1 hypothetical protein AMTR_s00010p00214510 [Amborella trichopoda]|eukprot:XP_006827005.1 photosynthetic NDH subunit of lumenal location 4, chloroplastic [Amborella trichopoda]